MGLREIKEIRGRADLGVECVCHPLAHSHPKTFVMVVSLCLQMRAERLGALPESAPTVSSWSTLGTRPPPPAPVRIGIQLPGDCMVWLFVLNLVACGVVHPFPWLFSRFPVPTLPCSESAILKVTVNFCPIPGF